MLAADVWFDVLRGTAQGAYAEPVEFGQHLERWIVQLDDAGLTPSSNVEQIDALLRDKSSHDVQPFVLRGLGLPGQVLVEALVRAEASPDAFFEQLSFVVHASRSTSVSGQLVPDDPEFSNQPHLSAASDADIDAPEAWNVTTGNSSVVVGLVDSGIDLAHPDLYLNVWLNPGEIPASLATLLVDANSDQLITLFDLNQAANQSFVTDFNGSGFIDAQDLLADNRWVDGIDSDSNSFIDDLFGWDFVNNDNNPQDDHGHGTHVAGIVGARGNNNLGVTGVAWQTSLLPLKFLNESNTGETINAILATNYLTALRARAATLANPRADSVNVRVANNSWGIGGGTGDPSLRDALAAAGDAGILVVAGAGNGDALGRGIDIDNAAFYPASFPLDNIISVAATDEFDRIATFSNFGLSTVDIAAPGVGILSTERGGLYGTRNGTSMATPLVSGVAALVFAAHPEASVSEARNAILSGADSLSGFNSLVARGARLNALGAVQAETFAPRATLLAAGDVLVAGGTTQDIVVRYADSNFVDAASFDNSDLVVTRMGFESAPLSPQLMGANVPGNGPVRDVTYRIPAPGGTWDAIDSGTYEIRLRDGQVRDVTNIASQARLVGTFRVAINNGSIFFVNTIDDTVDANPGDGVALDANGKTSLRAAIMEANAAPDANTVLLPAGRYGLTRAGANEDASLTGDFDVSSSITIIGDSANTTLVDGRELDRIFDVSASGNLSLRDVEVLNGRAVAGAGLRNQGQLTVTRIVIDNNVASSLGGGIANYSTLSIIESWLHDNESTAPTPEGGGGLYNSGVANVDRSTLSANRTAAGFGGTGGGGGIYNTADGFISLVNSTISGNVATQGNGGGIFSIGRIDSTNCTVVANAARSGFGGGIYNENSSSAPLAFQSTFGQFADAFDEILQAIDIAVDSRGWTYVVDNGLHRINVFDEQGIAQPPMGGFGTLPGQFNDPSALVVTSTGNLVVAERGNKRLQVFDANGQWLFTIPNIAATALAAGQNGDVYVTEKQDFTTPQIKVYNEQGAVIRTIVTNLPVSHVIENMAVTADGRIFGVSDYVGGTYSAFELGPSGALLNTFAIQGEDDANIFFGVRDFQLSASGDILLVDLTRNVKVFNQQGEYLRKIAGYDVDQIAVSPLGNFHVTSNIQGPPVRVIRADGALLNGFARNSTVRNIRSVEVAADGRAYVTDTENHRVLVYAADRSLQATIGSFGTGPGQFKQPSEVALSPNGQIVVADSGNNRIQVFDADGNYQVTIGSVGSGAGQFNQPTAIAFGSAGRLYVGDVANHRIQVFSSNYDFLFSFTSSAVAAGEFTPAGMAVDADGQVYVSSATDSRIHVFTDNGLLLRTIGGPGSGLGNIQGGGDLLIIAAQSQILFLDGVNNRIHAFGLDGSPLYVYGSLGVGNGQFDEPRSISADANGLIYVADDKRDNIQVLRTLPDGAGTVSLKNTIDGQNIALGDVDFAGSIVSGGHNLIGRVGLRINGVSNNVLGDLVGSAQTPISLLLGPLKFISGLAPVHIPLPSSPAISSGDNAGAPTIDQLGNPRPSPSTGSPAATVEMGAVELSTAEIRGTLFADTNGDGVLNANEQGLAGWTVFVDTNFNGILDQGESSTITTGDDAGTSQTIETGDYVLSQPANTYQIVAVRQLGYEPVAPNRLLDSAEIRIANLYRDTTVIQGLPGISLSPRVPVIDGKDVAFAVAEGIPSPDGSSSGAGYVRIDGDGLVWPLLYVGQTFPTEPWLDGGKLAFRSDALGLPFEPGIHVVDFNGNVQTIVRGSTLVPEGGGTFGNVGLSDGGISEGLTYFFTPSNGFSDARGFFIGTSESTLVRAVSRTALLPDGTTLGQFYEARFDGPSFALRAADVFGNTYGVFRGTPQSPLTVISQSSQIIPEGTGAFQDYFGLSLDGNRVAFMGIGLNDQSGLYAGTSTADLRRIADKTTPIPDGIGTFTNFGRVTAQDNGLLVFQGFGSDGQQGIYAEIGGLLRKIVAKGDVLAGGVVRSVEISSDAVSANRIALLVLTDTLDVYVATVETSAAQTVAVQTGQVLTGVNFAMQPERGSIGGTVFDDADADRVRSQGESTLAGWTVYVDQNANNKLDLDEPQTTTDATGNYKFADLATSQTYRLRVVVQPGFEATLPQFTPGLRTTFLAAGEEQASLSFGVRRAAPGSGVSGISGVLRGAIYQDNNGDGARNAGESGLAGWTVFVDTNRNGNLDAGERTTVSQADNPATTGTNEAGNYEFANLAQGDYSIGVVQQANVLQTSPRGNVFTDNALISGVVPSDVLAADFNADGAADVALAQRNTNSVQFLRNSGNGTLSDHLTIAGLSSPVALAKGDFNGDQKPDVVIANGTSDKISVLLHDGNPLGFGPLANYAAGFYQVDVLAMRVDNDALDDVVLLVEAKSAADSQGQLVVLRSTGSGFAAPTRIDVGARPRSVTAADVDGDGDQDLIVANTDSFNLQVRLNNNGVFAPGPVLTLGERPYFVLAADVTGDGRPELLAAAFDKGQVSVFTNTTIGATLQFSAAQAYAAGQGPQSLVAVDFDQDGDLDVAVANSSNKNVSLLRNRGGGVLSAPEGLGIASFQQGVGFALAAADLNQDSLPEILLAKADGNQLISGDFAGSLQRFSNQLATGTHRAAVPTGVEVVANLNFGMQPANLHQAPSIGAGQAFAIAENAAAATLVGNVLASDADVTESLTFALTSGNVGNAFTINAQGQLFVQNTAALNFEITPQFSLLVRVTDSTNLFDEKLVTVQLTNVNEAPTAISLSSSAVSENAAGATIGTVTVTDPDAGATHVLTVDDGRFAIVGGSLKLKAGVSLDRESQATVTLAITAKDALAPALSVTQSFSINVADVAERPTAITLSNASVAENAVGATIGTLTVVDPEGGPHELAVSDARFEISSNVLRLKPSVTLDFEQASSVLVFVTATDTTSLSLTESFTVSVTDVNDAPAITGLPQQITTIGVAVSGLAITVGDAETSATALVVQGSSSNAALLTNANVRITGTGAQRFVELLPTSGQSGTTVVTLTVTDAQGGASTTQFTLIVNNPAAAPLEVTSFTTTETGFVAQFSSALKTSVLNLYDLPLQFGAADLTFTGAATGSVRGSLLLDPTFMRATFVASAGVLAADIYTVRLKSGGNSFINAANNVLDGDRNGTPGDDFVTSFTVASSSTAAVVRIPSFARGPGQSVQLPATSSSGIPIELRNAAGAEAIFVRLKYDPALLDVTSATLGSGAPAGALLTTSINSGLHEITLSVVAPFTPFGSGTLELVRLAANVPMTAPYGAKQLLDVTQVLVNDGLRPALAEDGLHAVVFLGDTLGEATPYEPLMAQRIQRVEVGLDQGFAAYPLVDPRIIGNVVPDNVLGGLDAVRIYQQAVGIARPELPPLPSPLPTVPTTPGPDPHVYVPALGGIAGGNVAVPILLERIAGDAADLDLAAVQLRVRFPSQLLEIIDVLPGDLTADLSWTFISNVAVIDANTSEVTIAAARNVGVNPSSGALAIMNFRAKLGANGTAQLDLRSTSTGLRSNANTEALLLSPAPVDGVDANDATLVIAPGNTAPVANNDIVQLDEETTATINVLANDTDAQGPLNAASVTIVQPPLHGSVSVLAGGLVRYSPVANYFGSDSFTYRVADGQTFLSNVATVALTVRDVPEPYYNAVRPFDVNKSGTITAVDAVLVINQLNAGGGGNLVPPIAPATVSVFYDVNGDNVLSPLDALLVIIALNAGVQSEAPSVDAAAPPAGKTPIADAAAVHAAALWSWLDEKEEEEDARQGVEELFSA